ncbi:MAG TPA: hypothetical protein PLX83_01190, partial [bacterium]|nr:hypothetical protein [bacterium]
LVRLVRFVRKPATAMQRNNSKAKQGKNLGELSENGRENQSRDGPAGKNPNGRPRTAGGTMARRNELNEQNEQNTHVF